MILMILLYYWLIAGTVFTIYFLEVIRKQKDFEDFVADIRWNTGIDEESLFWAILFVSFIGGFYFLPSYLIKAIKIFIRRK